MVPFLIFLMILSWSLLVVLLSGWRRDRRLLGEARSALQVRGAERTDELEKANEDLRTSRARYDGDDKNGYSTDDDPHLGPDHRMLYFSSDQVIPAHFPRSPERAQLEFKRLDSLGWFSGYANVWSTPISAWLNADDAGKPSATK